MVIREFDLGKTVVNLKKSALSLAVSGAVIPLDKSGVLDKFGDNIKAVLPGLVKVHGLTEGFKEKFLSLTSQGLLPEGYFGHFTHLDHVVSSEALNALLELAAGAGYSNNLRRFAVTLATSVPGGQQSSLIKALYSKMESYVNERNVDFVAITRADKDVERYNMTPKISEKRALISKLRQRNVGVAIPAGDSVEPGRHPKGASGNRINGLQKIEDSDLVDLYETMERYRPTYFQPMAISGTWLYFNSDRLLPTPEAVAAFYYSENLGGIDLAGIIDRLGIKHDVGIDITLGMPITQEDMARNLGLNWRKNSQEVNDFLMIQVAKMLPPYARGYYGQFVKDEAISH